MIVGIDEVGRGCWAGPVVAAAVALRRPIVGLDDSKKLGKLRREQLDVIIRKRAAGLGVGWASVAEIDEQGLTEAVRLAMQRALEAVTIVFDELIIDGNYNYFPAEQRARAVIKADASVPAVSAASIIAKVARDRWMANEAAIQYPDYGFERHVGYGTALHREMLDMHGVCALHRRNWQPIRHLLENE